MTNFKRVLVLAMAMSIATNSFAFWGLLAPTTTAVMWLGRAASANVTMARAVEWSLLAHGAVISYFAWKNSGDTTAETNQPVKARLVVQPNTTSQRDNPDTTKWDNPASGLRNPTPKSSYTALGSSDYPSQSQAWSSIVSNAMNTPFDTYSTSAGIAYKKTYECMLTNVRPDNSTQANGSYTWTTEGTGTYNGATVYCWAKPTTTVTITCPSGYTASGTLPNTICSLSVPAATIQKPAGKVPCEVLQNSDGTWDVDSQNPECAKLASTLSRSNEGKALSYNKGDGTYDTVTTNADGSRTITTGNRTINIGPAGSDGNSTITGITDNGPVGTGSGTGTGAGSGATGSTGTGSAVCGGPGLPACSVSVEDSGFNGKDASINIAADAAASKLDDRQAYITAQGTDSGSFGLDNTWLPSLLPGPAVTCSALKWEPGISHGPLAGTTGSMDVDWCSKVDVFREYYAWLIGMITVWAIAMLFFSSNGNGGRGAK